MKAARHHAVAICKPEVSSADNLWEACEDLYGRGRGYRNKVASKLESWFEDQDELQQEVERRVHRAWEKFVLKPLREAAVGMVPVDQTLAEDET